MAQKKKVSVSSSVSKSAKVAETTTSARAKPAATKKTAVKVAAPKSAVAKSILNTKVKSTKPITKSAAQKATAKPAAKKAAVAKKTTATTAAVKPVAAKSAKPKVVAAKKATTGKSSPASKAAASTKSRIAAAAQMVAARRAAAAKEQSAKPAAAGRSLKAVAAAAPAPAKRSSAPVAPSAAEASPAAPKKPLGVKHGFKLHEYIVYPAHGVGQIVGIEEQEIAGMSLELFVITFDKDKMTLRVPTAKVDALRKLSEKPVVDKAMQTLKGRARVKRTMWSRRAQEYENKINSGDLIFIAEVVRDLYRSESQPEQSYSERQLYEAALDRMARELAAVEKLDERGAVQRITDVLSKSAKGRRQAEEEKAAAAAEAEATSDGDDVAAA
jgi:CarD family transcriptional regulator